MPLPQPPTKPLYAPGGGVDLRGTLYQGGERLARPDLAAITPEERRRLLGRAGAHADPKQAARDLAEHPHLTGLEMEAGRRLPRIGRAEPTGYEDPPLTAPRRKTGQGRILLPADLQDPALLTDEEAGRLDLKNARKLVGMLNKLPPKLEYKVAARGGEAQRYWYRDFAIILHGLFQADAPRFGALLAALSPQVDPRRNLINALGVWDLYQEWMQGRNRQGRGLPTYAEARQQLRDWKAAGAPVPAFPSWQKGMAIAMSHPDPGADTHGVLAERPYDAPKTDSFRRNLLGYLSAVTNDVWVSVLGGFSQDKLKRYAGEYLANNIQMRRVAHELNQELRPGETPWDGVQVQAATWSFVRSLAYVGGRSRVEGPRALNPVQALMALTHEDVGGASNFLKFMRKDPDVRQSLQRLGLVKAFDQLFAAYQKDTAGGAPALAGPVIPGRLPRLEKLAGERVARKAGQHVEVFGTPGMLSRHARPGEAAPMPPPAGPQEGLVAVSPNTEEGLSHEDAYQRTRSGNQKAFRQSIDQIREQIGLQGRSQDALGDWEDGAENSVLQTITHPQDPEAIRYAAAWYGLIGNQKSVLVFHPERVGKDSVYTIQVPDTNLQTVRQRLQQYGIAFRTLIPGRRGTRVLIYDQNRELRPQVAHFAGAYHAEVRESIGTGEFLGANSRSAARRRYREVIDAYERKRGTHARPLRANGPTGQPHHGGPAPRQAGPTEAAEPNRLGKRGLRLRYSGIHSPAGGVIYRGQYYRGGNYIPHAELEKAGYEQHQQIEGQRARKYRRADGSYDAAADLAARKTRKAKA